MDKFIFLKKTEKKKKFLKKKKKKKNGKTYQIHLVVCQVLSSTKSLWEIQKIVFSALRMKICL